MSNQSQACCRIPPVIGDDYQPKGTYIELNGTKTYVTGPANADKAILSVYDIFGFFPQTIQGADILAHGDTERQYQVYMPDFFERVPAKIEWYPPKDAESGELMGRWFNDNGTWPKHLPKVRGFIEAAEKRNPNIKSWGIMGYCWGSKVASILAGDEEPLFKAVVQTSPTRADAADAAKVKIPAMLLASGDEDAEEIKAYGEGLRVPKHVEFFDGQVHGFMSARADLKDAQVRAEYERGYKMSLEFFHRYLW
ncbi:alpha/beta-hydrolase [Hypoxylon sp. FL1284]|nr:alpha/beta-hydrolase [Hypoxylon sp. FL1284]